MLEPVEKIYFILTQHFSVHYVQYCTSNYIRFKYNILITKILEASVFPLSPSEHLLAVDIPEAFQKLENSSKMKVVGSPFTSFTGQAWESDIVAVFWLALKDVDTVRRFSSPQTTALTWRTPTTGTQN